ncbi:MAG TPA: glycoside hydrolase family 9 protein [Lacunisphaera sp.]|nr:glycoside hydrolase family 9 protein [Lacunisphaera sp.]
MKYSIRAVIAALVMSVFVQAARAVEGTWNYAVQVTAAVQASPAKITLSWTQDSTSTPSSYTVYRKAVGATFWGTGTALPGSTLSYTDTNVTVGTAYEYQVVRAASGYQGYGYIQSGIDVPLVENRGKVVLVVDQTQAAPLATEITRLQDDLRGDGWTVIRRDVSRTDSVTTVKAQIVSAYNSDPANVKAVFLLGHVPVPYSGQLNPDGHPDHTGAWPADAYYGDVDGNWTDSSVNYTQAQNSDTADGARLTNKPGDGKFDQTTLPSAIELQVGRVDLSKMPGLTAWNSPASFASETELLRQYLNKDHNFRHRIMNVQRRAIVGDYFGIRSGEAFAASGYRNAATFVGSDKVTNLNSQYNDQQGVFTPAVAAGDYLFAYGCGAGSYRSIGGLGNVGNYHDTTTVEIVSNDAHGVFNMLFGSWLGDWDHEDSLLRAPLATRTNGLASMWSGRPHWFIHGMGLGETIGAGTRVTQNNTGLYRNMQNNSANMVHVALMGDPTLRLHPVAPPAALGGASAGSVVTLTWTPSTDSIVGYNVYRAASDTAAFTKLNSSLLTVPTYVDASAPAGAIYMVRAIKHEVSPSGSYFNASQGLLWKVGGSTPPPSSGDTTAPMVSLTAPAASSTVSGTAVTLTASASDNVGVAGVQFQLDGANLGAEDTAAPFTAPWNSSTVSNGAHTLRAIARDAAGNITTSAGVSVTVSNTTVTPPSTPPATSSGAWVDDALPAGATGSGSGGDTWNWVTSNPVPYSGTKAHQSAIAAGLHEHSFNWASATMSVATGDMLYAYIYLDPANPPTEIMISWLSNNWEHRAYWGANSINYGTNGTASRRQVGALPATGQWVRLEVPASQVGLEGQVVKGMSFGLFGGRATWDSIGRAPAGATTPPPSTGGAATVTVAATDTNAVIGTTDNASFTFTRTGSTTAALKVKFTLSGTAVKWLDYRRPEGDMPVEMTIPAGAASVVMNLKAIANTTGANPQTVIVTVASDAAYSIGTQKSGTATITLPGQTVPAPVTQTSSTSWDRAVNSANIPLSIFDLDNATGPTTGGLPVVTVAATDASAMVGSADNATFSFTRSGSTAAALKVKFALSGTAVKWTDYRRPEGDMPVEMTIPAGAASVAMNIMAIANATNANPQTMIVTLAPDSTYAVGSARSGTATFLPAGTVVAQGGSGAGSTGGTGSTGGSTGGNGSTGGTTTGGTVDASADPVSIVDYTKLQIPAVGSSLLHVLSPTTLELVRINTAPAGGAVDSWNFVDASGNFTAPATNKLAVTVNGQAVAVQSVGFKRRPLYAPLVSRDLRIASTLVLQLASPVADGQTVEVKNADATLWPAAMTFKAVAQAMRYSPAIHVNQEGYVPSLPKKAAVGYYLGNLGEMAVPNLTFSIVEAVGGRVVYQGALVARPDTGWTYAPTPYQKVYEADFSSFAAVGEYKLVVPGLGASLPFLIDDGIGMAFARTYAQGLYHQRCGLPNELPFTRHTHAACHLAPATVPVSTNGYTFTWNTIAGDTSTTNPAQTAPVLSSPAAQLYPFVNQGPIDVSGGHHDAGDYSKYTINSATLVHTLMFAVDSMSGIATFDNLGLPESGDGISDVLQEAKIEADFLAKLQDADGGFYFLVYPRERKYENNVTPDRGDLQVVWPKNTSATAAAVAALAEIASSPKFKTAYPQAAAAYLAKAKTGWKFLTDAIAKYGKAGAYQKLTHYGDDFAHDDELAWAAAAMFVATGDTSIHSTLKSWYNPADPATWRWGWWHGFMGWGNANRTYAFAARSGRLAAGQLDAAYLAKCEAEVRSAANDALTWSQHSAYGTSFPDDSKRVQSAGWYFSGSQSFDLAVARQLDARADYVDAMVRNLNYEGGSNAINVSYLTGLGWKRQKEIVHQYAQNDERALPPNGIPLGNLQTGPIYTATYGTELAALTFPRDNAGSAPHGFYDRWSDTFNVTTEFVHLDQARGLASFAYLASMTPAKSQAWKSAAATITGIPASPALGAPLTVGLQVAGMDLEGARILWEAKGTAPAYGETYTFTPGSYGAQWVEAEAQWPDGRRAVARANLFAENGLPTVTVAATDASATIGSTTDTATWTFTRAGNTAGAITVNFKFNGTAAKWSDYRRPEGDMPSTVTIPAGATSATITIKAIANTTSANPQTAILCLLDGTGYNVGTVNDAAATVTIH